ncbi:MAG TPA: alpha-ketoglutarate-dependent dioxygenase AlkB [Candidatus Binatia bacterium]
MPKTNGDLTLFDASARVPDGFIYRKNFISEAEEQELIEEIQKVQLEPFKYYQFTGKRRTASFGWQYEFGASEITVAPEMPPFLSSVRTRAGTVFSIDPNTLIQTSIIEYSIGSPIGWHRDIPQFGVVVGISLGAACRMRFRKYSRVRTKQLSPDEVLSIELQPRSIYLMSGASRESWQHSIPPVKQLRYAIMMRTLRAKPESPRDRSRNCSVGVIKPLSAGSRIRSE